ncbi:hypothetical protein [Shinella zoogloeoides]|uniref:hypothetical protein n=1 Tax=Shinella zoogloeoides TaxID=352475 RepID=UPI0028AB4F6D|nr:hypothetical protein [Shinella zoogloeoides]
MAYRHLPDLTPGTVLDSSMLSGTNVYVNSRQHSVTLQDIPEWYGIGARCSRCKHASMLDRWELAYRYGKKRVVMTLEPKLRCTRCNNREANDFVLAKLRR